MSIAEIEYRGAVLWAKTPYRPQFIASLKESIPWRSRKWRPEERVWEVARAYEAELLQLCEDYFDVTKKIDGKPDERSERPAPQYSEYDLLYVRPGAPIEIVEAAYRAVSKMWHPDLRPESEKQVATARMAAINAAVEKLRKEANGNARH